MQIAISFTIWVIFEVFRYIILLTDVPRIKGNGSTVCTIWGKTRDIIRFTSERTLTTYEYIYIHKYQSKIVLSARKILVTTRQIKYIGVFGARVYNTTWLSSYAPTESRQQKPR